MEFAELFRDPQSPLMDGQLKYFQPSFDSCPLDMQG